MTLRYYGGRGGSYKLKMGQGGLNEPAMTKNGPNDVDTSFGPLVSFLFAFSTFFDTN